MYCLNPYIFQNHLEKYEFAIPCRKCELCRVYLKQDWSNRIELEALTYPSSDVAFITLTYDEANLPFTDNKSPTLKYTDIQSFLKRLRASIDYKIRFFCVGEYGSTTYRPHYHIIFFGLKQEDYPLVNKYWGKGIVDCKVANNGAFKYVSGYVNKKFDKKQQFWQDSEPEFVRTSQGLGKRFCESLSESFISNKLIHNNVLGLLDIQDFILIGDRKVRLPKYVKDKLRKRVFSQEHLLFLKVRYMEMATERHYSIMSNMIFDDCNGLMHPRFFVSEAYLKDNEARLLRVRYRQNIIERKRKI